MGAQEANKWFQAMAKERYETHKAAATSVDNPESHIKDNQHTPPAFEPRPKSLSEYVITALNVLKTGSYYLASIGIYAGATGVLASCALATFVSILPVAVPPLVFALVIGGGMVAGAFIGLSSAHKGESLLPPKSHWSDMLGMTHLWRRLELPTSGTLNSNITGLAATERR
ncbi:hypothetical protein [Sansalvadorimonas verongulae]|uniref:hypothetical protein n=1 Tax=Sansalvadorimonas verongulae TaxID=2172824 RepID=UPI0012BBE443|nr:hypothetical protein [Sansalvadorimonas verongulae]MTI14808.1 hypothetical protein [Sansalvadorimonas verongulae]